jgi:hypothetical protein
MMDWRSTLQHMAFGEHFRSKPDNFTLLKYRAKEQELRIE